MKKHTLEEHEKDVLNWYFRVHSDGPFNGEKAKDRCFFIAYERWLNDRVLLTEENKKEQL